MTDLEENSDGFPDERRMYNEARHLVQLQRLYGLKVIDVVEGCLGPDMIIQPALTRKSRKDSKKHPVTGCKGFLLRYPLRLRSCNRHKVYKPCSTNQV